MPAAHKRRPHWLLCLMQAKRRCPACHTRHSMQMTIGSCDGGGGTCTLWVSISAPAGCRETAVWPGKQWPGLSAERQCHLDQNTHRSCTCTLLAAGAAHTLNKVHPLEDPSQVQLFGRCGCTGRQPALRKTCKWEGVALKMHLLATGRHHGGCRMPVKCVVMSQQHHLRWSISASGCSAAWAATERRLHCC